MVVSPASETVQRDDGRCFREEASRVEQASREPHVEQLRRSMRRRLFMRGTTSVRGNRIRLFGAEARFEKERRSMRRGNPSVGHRFAGGPASREIARWMGRVSRHGTRRWVRAHRCVQRSWCNRFPMHRGSVLPLGVTRERNDSTTVGSPTKEPGVDRKRRAMFRLNELRS